MLIIGWSSGVCSADLVAGRDADAAGPLRPPGDRGKAAFRLHQQVVGLHLRIGAGLAVARDVAGNEQRMFLAQPGVTEAEPSRGAARQVLAEVIGKEWCKERGSEAV